MNNNIQHQPNMKRNDDIEDTKFIILQESPQQRSPPLPPPPPATTSPPSASASPTHEFSFTISLQPQPPKINHDKTTTNKPTAPPPPPFAIDLSPADDIFFHGHLLPLHLLSHLPVSPRSSTNSLDSFTLPKELLHDDDQNTPTASTSTNNSHSSSHQSENSEKGGSTKIKSKSFSIFGLPKWRKGYDDKEKERESDRDCPYKKKHSFDLSHVLKRYARMVKQSLSFRGSKRSSMEVPHQPYSYSGNLLSARGKAEFRRRRGELSAPTSMRTSPTNSGILLATSSSGAISPTKSSSDSTMEELQAAIQAAIAHCKNSNC